MGKNSCYIYLQVYCIIAFFPKFGAEPRGLNTIIPRGENKIDKTKYGTNIRMNQAIHIMYHLTPSNFKYS
jgi:hypothetical protein